MTGCALVRDLPCLWTAFCSLPSGCKLTGTHVPGWNRSPRYLQDPAVRTRDFLLVAAKSNESSTRCILLACWLWIVGRNSTERATRTFSRRYQPAPECCC